MPGSRTPHLAFAASTPRPPLAGPYYDLHASGCGRPISSYRLAERLRGHGIHSGQARSTALFQLATDLPAAVLARLLGIHITVAVAWQRASNGDWAAYAADVSRRATT